MRNHHFLHRAKGDISTRNHSLGFCICTNNEYMYEGFEGTWLIETAQLLTLELHLFRSDKDVHQCVVSAAGAVSLYTG